MKKMNKMLAMLLSAAMVLGLTACGSSQSGDSSAAKTEAATTAAATEAAAEAATEAAAQSQESADLDWPKETITLVVPASAGGGTDLMARLWAEYASKKLGVSVVVSNVSGSGGSTGIMQAHDSDPDGYTALFFHNNVVINYLSGLTTYTHEDGFETGPEFAYDDPCSIFINANNSYGWKTLDDVIATAKENPGTVTVATELGSYTYFELLALQNATGAEFAITDGGSNSEKVTGLLGNAFDVMLNSYTTAGSYAETGEFLCLGIPTAERSDVCPDVPTLKEQGIDMTYDGYYFSLFFPKGTDQRIIDKIDQVTAEICADEAVQAKLAEMNYQDRYVSAEENKTQFTEMLDYYKNLLNMD